MESWLDPLSPVEPILYYSLEFLGSLPVVKTLNMLKEAIWKLRNVNSRQNGIFVDLSAPHTVRWQRPKVFLWYLNLVRTMPIGSSYWWRYKGRDWPARVTYNFSSDLLFSFLSFFDKYVLSIHYCWNCSECWDYKYEQDMILALQELSNHCRGKTKWTDSNRPLISCSELYLT